MSELDTRRATEWLLSAQRPLVLLGPECKASVGGVVAIADRLGAALLTTPDALSLVDGARSCGVFSFGASQHARRSAEACDVVLAFSDLGEFSCRLGEAFRGKTLIQVSAEARDGNASVTLREPARSVPALLNALFAVPSKACSPWCSHRTAPSVAPVFGAREGLIHPVAAIRAVQAALPESARICLDVSSAALYAYQYLAVAARRQRVFSSIERSACMGEALLASLGVRLASGLPTLTLVGDCGYSMVAPEIHTAVELGLGGYVVVVWANQGGAFIGAGVAQQGIRVPDEVWRFNTPPRFASAGDAYGAQGVRVSDAASLERALREAFEAPSPVLIEACIDPDVPIPAGDRFLTLSEARA
ncbi:MAG: thiamine pyrophosphate-dependent enzyme [Polyangiaceae bacterium]